MGMDQAEYDDRLRQQLAYINQRILEGVRDIVAHDPDAVIVVFSEHGTGYDPEDLQEYFNSFLAARTPGHPGLFGDSPSPVNYMSSLFNSYFGTSLPSQEYRAWVSTGNPLDLRAVLPTPGPQ